MEDKKIEEEIVSNTISIQYTQIYKDLLDLQKCATREDKTTDCIDVMTVYRNIAKELKQSKIEILLKQNTFLGERNDSLNKLSRDDKTIAGRIKENEYMINQNNSLIKELM